MTQFLFVVAAVICFIAPPWEQGSRPNLTGKWTLDAARSDFGQSPQPDSIIHVIEHKEPKVKITTTTIHKNVGESMSEQDLTTDGKEHINKMRAMGAEVEVKVIGKWDGDSLSTSWGFVRQGTTVEFNDSWSLSADGKALTLVRVAKTPQGDFSVRTVYNKQ
jgi:hypothetical protein